MTHVAAQAAECTCDLRWRGGGGSCCIVSLSTLREGGSEIEKIGSRLDAVAPLCTTCFPKVARESKTIPVGIELYHRALKEWVSNNASIAYAGGVNKNVFTYNQPLNSVLILHGQG